MLLVDRPDVDDETAEQPTSNVTHAGAVHRGSSELAITQILARILGRHPTAPPTLVQRCVDEAASHFRDARVQSYLPILIERRASDAVRTMLHSAGRT